MNPAQSPNLVLFPFFAHPIHIRPSTKYPRLTPSHPILSYYLPRCPQVDVAGVARAVARVKKVVVVVVVVIAVEAQLEVAPANYQQVRTTALSMSKLPC